MSSAQGIYGVGGYAGSPGTLSGAGSYATGVEGQGWNSSNATGVSGVAKMDVALTGTNGNLYGLTGTASSNQSRTTGSMFGLNAWASPDAGATWFEVYGAYLRAGNTGSATNAFGVKAVVGLGTNRYAVYGDAGGYTGANPTWAGFFNGKTFCTLSAWSSDRGLKQDIEPLTGNIGLLQKLKPSRYQFRHDVHPALHLPSGDQFGLIAQDVEEVIPAIVENVHQPEVFDEEGKLIEAAFDFKALNYVGLIPILIGGIQEQQAIIDDKQSQIDALTNRLEKLEAKISGEGKRGDVAPGMGKPELFQNTPNPFNETTVIRYSLPEVCGKCAIEVMDMNGRIVSTFANLSAGQGQLMIAAGALSAGSYTYTMIVNGERADSKTMVITR